MSEHPRIHIIGTGGTIAGQGGSPTDEAYEPGRIDTAELLDAVEGLNRRAEISSESLFSSGSEDLGPEQWWTLAQRVQALSEKSDPDAIVITHGTDTLEEAAFFLDLVCRPAKPVVMTAAMRPATALSADGPANIDQAVLASAGLARTREGRGVFVSMNGLVLPGWQTLKTNSLGLGAFGAFPGGPAGRVTRSRLMQTGSLAQSPARGDFHALLKKAPPLPKVGMVLLNAGCGAEPLAVWRASGCAGLVIAGFGAGTMPSGVCDLAHQMAGDDLIIVVSTRVGEGTVLPESARVRRASGLIAAGFLNPQKSALLLSLALAAGLDRDGISALFERFYAAPQD